MLLVALLLHLMAAQQGNDLNKLLRGSQQAVNSHASSYAPGTQMFEEAHKSWLPKLPQRDSSGLPESTSAEQLTGASFMSQPDQIQKPLETQTSLLVVHRIPGYKLKMHSPATHFQHWLRISYERPYFAGIVGIS